MSVAAPLRERTKPSIVATIKLYRERAEAALERRLPTGSTKPERLHTALRYAVLGGGKRLRAALVYATGETLQLPQARLDGIAVAIEFVHAYSLVHDDLPAMDDDALRRGRATLHIAFDEATALLVGDALQALAYEVLATEPTLEADAAVRRQLVLDLARASGAEGMVGGQAMDMQATGAGNTLSVDLLEDLYRRKTGALLHAAVIMPGRLQPGLPAARLAALDDFGRALGLAYQIADDLLDLESPAEVSGKPQGSDLRNNKSTLLSLLGVDASRRRLESLREQAHAALAVFEDAVALKAICEQATRRDR